MESGHKSYKIIITVSLFVILSLITISMLVKVRYSTTPEGIFENYKWWIVESVEKWTKDRDNEYYDKQTVINWYETKDSNGVIPKDNFPDFIYQEIKDALIMVFENQELSSKDPDETKKIISNKLDSRKGPILKLMKNNNKKGLMDGMTPGLVNMIFYSFVIFIALFFIRLKLK